MGCVFFETWIQITHPPNEVDEIDIQYSTQYSFATFSIQFSGSELSAEPYAKN